MASAQILSLFDIDYRLVPTGEPPAEAARIACLARSPAERAEFTFQRITIHTPEFDQSVECADAILQRGRSIQFPGGLLLTGEGGSGKTFIADYLLRRYPPQHTRTQSFIPLIRVDISEKPRPEEVQRSIASALGHIGSDRVRKDPSPEKQAQEALSECRTHGIIFNEAHRVMLASGRRNDVRAAGPVGDYLMRLYDDTKIAFLFLAKPGLIELWNQDTQLRTRWPGQISLSYFADDPVWEGLMAAMDDALPMEEPSKLNTPEIRTALWITSSGKFRMLKYFLSESVRIAASEGARCLTPDIFARTFQRLAFPGTNPFG